MACLIFFDSIHAGPNDSLKWHWKWWLWPGDYFISLPWNNNFDNFDNIHVHPLNWSLWKYSRPPPIRSVTGRVTVVWTTGKSRCSVGSCCGGQTWMLFLAATRLTAVCSPPWTWRTSWKTRERTPRWSTLRVWSSPTSSMSGVRLHANGCAKRHSVLLS